MKKCRICSSEYDNGEVRCSVCGTLLPQTEVPASASERKKLIKKCSYCGTINTPDKVRCRQCNHFLGRTQGESLSGSVQGVIVTAELETGETVSLRNNDIIGREYQPSLWDAYTSRALYKVYSDNGVIMLENIKYRKRVLLDYNKEYQAGRKKFKFIKKAG